MKLLHITMAVVLSATFAVRAFAGQSHYHGEEEVSDGSLVELQGDAVQAGSTDAARVSYWSAMKPDRQQLWQQHCGYTAGDAARAQKDTPERQAFCKTMPNQ
jgi:hypothetical protein